MLFRCAVGVLSLLAGPLCLAQVVTVRVINGANGRPLQKQNVSLYPGYEKGEKTPPNYDGLMVLGKETDANGQARFTLPEPAPSSVWVRIALSSTGWYCEECDATAATADLLQKGIVIGSDLAKSTKTATQVKVPPGELLFIVRRVPFYWRLLHLILDPLERG